MISYMSAWARRLVVAAAVGLAAACGGGEQVNPFQPRRMVSFGDQTSAIESDGRKYTVNFIDLETDAIDCKQNPNWVQVVSNSYGFSFEQCHDEDQTPESLLYAKAGAKAADIEQQIDAHLAADDLTGRDLVTLSAGINDVLEQYAAYSADPAAGFASQMKVLGERGAALAAQVRRLTDTGAKVVVVRTYGLGSTPFANAQTEANEDEDAAAGRQRRAEVIAAMSEEFNISLLDNMPDDGRKVATVDGIATIGAMVSRPLNFSLENVEDALCKVETPDCSTTSADLTNYTGDDGTSYSTPVTWLDWLWADATNLSPRGHLRLGQLAYSRATNNPFGND